MNLVAEDMDIPTVAKPWGRITSPGKTIFLYALYHNKMHFLEQKVISLEWKNKGMKIVKDS